MTLDVEDKETSETFRLAPAGRLEAALPAV
jgi:hypothetical protein